VQIRDGGLDLYIGRGKTNLHYDAEVMYEGGSSQAGTFTDIKRDASVAVLHAVVSGKCVLLLIGGAHVAGQSRDR
jgi:hypothetical protein